MALFNGVYVRGGFLFRCSGVVATANRVLPVSVMSRANHGARRNATGMDKYELIARRAENDNPFDTYLIKPDAGTGIFANNPILIPSTKSCRMVGCCCEEDYDQVVWFNLEKGATKRCDCGYYFKLIDYDPLDPAITPIFGKGFGSGMSRYY